MIEPIKMKPQQSTNFKGLTTTSHDPLDARSSYASVLKKNEGILRQETLKIKGHDQSKQGNTINLKG